MKKSTVRIAKIRYENRKTMHLLPAAVKTAHLRRAVLILILQTLIIKSLFFLHVLACDHEYMTVIIMLRGLVGV